MEQRAKELSEYLRGWRGYFGFCQTPSVLKELDTWLRRRLRSVIWKQWKRGNKRFAELRKRDIGRGLAAKTAGSAHASLYLGIPPIAAECRTDENHPIHHSRMPHRQAERDSAAHRITHHVGFRDLQVIQ